MTYTVSRTHDTLAHVLDAQGRRVSRHDLISDAYAEAERLNKQETTMGVETSETLASDYDTGLLNDFGGGNVDWWWDYLRDEIGRANEHWRIQHEALAAANAQLERERDAARKIAENLAIEAVAALHEGETLRRERDAATAALAKAEGERDRMQEVLRSVLPHAWAAEYHDDWIGDGVRREACTTAEAALTPAPEAPKDGE